MNKILLDEELIELVIEEDKELEFYDNNSKNKTINIIVKKNVKVNITEIEKTSTNNIFNYYLEENSYVKVNKFYVSENVKEKDNVYLNGENSNINLNISCISKSEHDYSINIYHNNKKTTSNTSIHGITLKDEKITIVNNGYVKSDSTMSNLNQDNKVITMFKNNSTIKPNLFIDEFDSYASHGAYIGKFEEDKIFYLKCRGINGKTANELLIIGFLLNTLNISDGVKKELTENIKRELEVNL